MCPADLTQLPYDGMKLLLFNLATDADDPILGFTTQWIRALANRVESVRVLTMRAGRIDVPENVEVFSVGKERGYSEPRRAVEFYRHLFRILREDRIDVCFSHMIPVFTVLAGPVLRVRRVPIVTWYAHPSVTPTLKLAHHLSNRMVASLSTAYPYKRDRLTVVGQGIDTDLFAPNGAPPREPPTVLCVGRLSPVKDHRTLLQAVARLQARCRKTFQVVVLGGPASPQDDPYAQALKEQVRELGIGEVVHFEPALPPRDLPAWYRQCAVHVNLTPTGFGDKVAWEAMSCGRPCLAANEGFRETLGQYADRLLFRHSDPADLAERLNWTLSQTEDELTRIGACLREQVIRQHSLERLADKLLQTFLETQPGRPQRRPTIAA